MPLIFLLWGVFYILFGAVININNGLGYDGGAYAWVIKDFYNLVLNDKLDSYLIQRIFPLFLTDLLLTVFKLPKEDFYIIKFFQIYNLILIMLCSFIWYKISKIYRLDLIYIWLGLILVLLNFGIAENSFYYPVLTDTTAFFLGFCLLYFHLKDNLTGKIIITILGAFTWPSLIFIGILMIIFPINSNFSFSFSNNIRKKSLNIYLAFLLPLLFLIVSIHHVYKYFMGESFYNIFTPVFSGWLYIDSILNYLLMVFFFYSFLPKGLSFSNGYLFLKKVIRNIKIKNILISVSIFAVIYFVQIILSHQEKPKASYDVMGLIYYISLYGISKPFGYFVTAVTYFGPSFIILFFFLKYFKNYLLELGLGVYLSFILSFLLIFITETRIIINFFPFIVLLSVLVIRNFTLNKEMFFWICLFSLILSKIYIPMFNIPSDMNTYKDFFNFTNQLYFMNSFIISKTSYYILGTIILFMTFFIVYKIKRGKVHFKNHNNVLKVYTID
ncbi:MAG: hypothetical protein M3R36_08060 [Bacteroidota bacterium]|nr:hypothetical protein [Bacteroidota bacterium]